MNSAVHTVSVVRVGAEKGTPGHDLAATEEPLELRLGDRPFVVIMRTPGQDHELAAGFLLAEQIVRNRSEIGSIRHCAPAEQGLDRAAPEGSPAADETTIADHAGNVLNVWVTGDAALRASTLLANRRAVTSNSSCGVCGRQSIEDLMTGTRPVAPEWTITADAIRRMPDMLRTAQKAFDDTGGLHAAGLFDREGRLLRVAEDIGRHNAVDKVIGASVLAGDVPLSDHVLFVSGRTSFEIVQKALVAGIPMVASVSAPSSLAIALARSGNVTLLGFVRGLSFNVYSVPERILA